MRESNPTQNIDSLYLIEFNSVSSSLSLNIVLTSLAISIVEPFFEGRTNSLQNSLIILNFFMLIVVLIVVLFANALINPEESQLKARLLIGGIILSLFTISITIFLSFPII